MICWVCTVLMRLALMVISSIVQAMATPKATYSFNGPLMWFVLYLPVSSNVLLDSDEAELFICSSWSWYRHTITHLVPSSLMWTFSGCKVRNFLWRCLIMQRHTQTSLNPSCVICSTLLLNHSLKTFVINYSSSSLDVCADVEALRIQNYLRTTFSILWVRL